MGLLSSLSKMINYIKCHNNVVILVENDKNTMSS